MFPKAEEHNRIANEAFRSGDYPTSYKYFSKAIKSSNKTCAKYYTNRARASLKVERYDLAFDDADAAIALEPDNIKAHYCKGEALFGKRAYQLAQHEFELALALAPQDTAILRKVDQCKMQHFEMTVKNDEMNKVFKANTNKELAELVSKIKIGQSPFGDKMGSNPVPLDSAAMKDHKMLQDSVPFVIAAHKSRDGINQKQSYHKALELYGKAADLGNTEAMYNLALMHKHGHGVPIDFAKAHSYLVKAASQPLFMSGPGNIPRLGVALAHNSLGIDYREGFGVAVDLEKSFKHFKISAEGGDAYGASNLGCAYQAGLGTSVDILKAIEAYTQAAEKDHPPAQYNLGLIYFQGDPGVVNKDIELARKWLTRASELGDSDSTLFLSRLDNCSLKSLQTAAETGNAKAMFELADAYENGVDLPEPDLEKALYWFKKAKNKKLPEAQFRLGLLYLYKIPTTMEPDRIEKGIQWIKRAAQLNVPQAQILLSEFCFYGEYGIKRDIAQSKLWGERAIENGAEVTTQHKPPTEHTDAEFKELLRRVKDWEISQGFKDGDGSSISEPMTNKARVIRYNQAEAEKYLDKFYTNPEDVEKMKMVSRSLFKDLSKLEANPLAGSLPPERPQQAQGDPYSLEKLTPFKNTKFGRRMFEAKYCHLQGLLLFSNKSEPKYVITQLYQGYSQCDFVCCVPSSLQQPILEVVRTFVRDHPSSWEAKYVLAMLISRRQLETQISLINDCVALNPEAIIYKFRGALKCFAEQYSEAIIDFTEGLRVCFDSDLRYDILYHRAAAYRLSATKSSSLKADTLRANTLIDAALADYKLFLELAPSEHRKIPEALYGMAGCYMLKTDKKEIDNLVNYYHRGLEAEAKRMPIFEPLDFQLKSSLQRITTVYSIYQKNTIMQGLASNH